MQTFHEFCQALADTLVTSVLSAHHSLPDAGLVQAQQHKLLQAQAKQ
jgi:hypothetical protein